MHLRALEVAPALVREHRLVVRHGRALAREPRPVPREADALLRRDDPLGRRLEATTVADRPGRRRLSPCGATKLGEALLDLGTTLAGVSRALLRAPAGCLGLPVGFAISVSHPGDILPTSGAPVSCTFTTCRPGYGPAA